MSFSQIHQPLVYKNEITNTLRLFNKKIQGTAVYLWAVAPQGDVSFYHKNEISENTLFVFISTNYSYYHQIEVVFHQISAFQNLPEIWRPHPATDALTFEKANQGYHFYLNDDEGNKLHINAQGISIYTGTVYYYNRPKLTSNEKIALFVKSLSTHEPQE